MITVSNLTKKFGATTVLNQISFQVKQGEILGFLGPNGAGKTTTMRILTGVLSPTDGSVQINEHDILDESLAIRKQIGYLPENNPLYENLRVYEYLEFMARTKQLTAVGQAVKDSVKVCNLQDKLTSPIAELSKGYRQRVGLAAALLGNPAILLLDEPTSGLDPNQAAEIRKLIRSIGKTKTVIFSTHILQEVQAICDRALIIHQGKIVAQGTVAELVAHAQGQIHVRAIIEGPTATITAELQKISGVQKVVADKENFQLTAVADQGIRRAVFNVCVANHWILLEMQKTEISLEDVFRQLTTTNHV